MLLAGERLDWMILGDFSHLNDSVIVALQGVLQQLGANTEQQQRAQLQSLKPLFDGSRYPFVFLTLLALPFLEEQNGGWL